MLESFHPSPFMELTKLLRRRATDEVYDALRRAILSGLFRPGERLQIEEIAQKLGVSLTPVRHAIQQLAAEGLIRIHPRSGTYVARLSAREVQETFEIRAALECLAAELAIARINDDILARFRQALEALNRPVASEEDRREHEEANLRFHSLLIEASGNRKLAEIYQALNAHLQIARAHCQQTDWAGRLNQEQAEHEEIVAAAEARDRDRLIQAVRRHIERAKNSLSQMLPEGE